MPSTHAFTLWSTASVALANGGQFNAVNGANQWQNTTENFYQSILGRSATFAKLSSYLSEALSGGGTLNFRANGATGNQFLSTGGGPTGIYTDSTHSDAVSSGGTIDYISTLSLYSPYWISCDMASSAPYHLLGVGNQANTNGSAIASAVGYTNIVGDCSSTQASASVTNTQEVLQAGTASGMAVNMGVAPTGTATFHFMVGGANGNQAVTTTGVTGPVQDTTHSDAVAFGAQISSNNVCTDATGRFQHVGFSFNSTHSTLPYLASINTRTSAGSVFYVTAGGGINNAQTTITTANVPVAVSFTATNLVQSTDTANVSTGSKVQFFNNSVAGNMVVPYPSGTTGFNSDATHMDSCSAGNPVCTQYTPGTGSYFISMVGFGLDDGSAPTATPNSFAAIQG
jgi:hypothetical protein